MNQISRLLIILSTHLFTSNFSLADAPPGTLINRVELPKGGYIVLQVTDAKNQIRKFLVTCETELSEEQLSQIRVGNLTFVPLKMRGYQSLINYWLKPAVDHYVVCLEEAITQREKSGTAPSKSPQNQNGETGKKLNKKSSVN